VNSCAPVGQGGSCFASDTRQVPRVKYPVISHEREKRDRIVTTTNGNRLLKGHLYL
jgi:hypothetical protein